MEMIFKYPRTRHLEGSRKQQGDQDLKAVPFKEISGRYLVLEEKIDGANCGISFGADGRTRWPGSSGLPGQIGGRLSPPQGKRSPDRPLRKY